MSSTNTLFASLIQRGRSHGVLLAQPGKGVTFVWGEFVSVLHILLHRWGIDESAIRYIPAAHIRSEHDGELIIGPLRSVVKWGYVSHGAKSVIGINLDPAQMHYQKEMKAWGALPHGVVLDWSPCQVALWQSHGFHSVLCPTTWLPALAKVPEPPTSSTWDAVFVGHNSVRRNAVMASLRKAGLSVPNTTRFWRDKKAYVISHAAVLLNITYKDIARPRPFQLHRIMDYARHCPQGFVCVTDAFDDKPWGDIMPWVIPVTHAEDFAMSVCDLLEDPERYRRLKEKSREFYIKYVATETPPPWCCPDMRVFPIDRTFTRKLRSRYVSGEGFRYAHRLFNLRETIIVSSIGAIPESFKRENVYILHYRTRIKDVMAVAHRSACHVYIVSEWKSDTYVFVPQSTPERDVLPRLVTASALFHTLQKL